MGRQFCAENLTVRRVLLQLFLRVVDVQPVKIHSLYTESEALIFLGPGRNPFSWKSTCLPIS